MLLDLAEEGPIFKSLTGQVPSRCKGDFFPVSSRNPSVDELVDIACARTVYIDLIRLVDQPKETLLRVLLHAIYEKATGTKILIGDLFGTGPGQLRMTPDPDSLFKVFFLF